ncbi:DUF481 domain-containing protein [bacterium]|nr:DUF481 domain-containing protein [bacterium]
MKFRILATTIFFVLPVLILAHDSTLTKRIELGYVSISGNARSETISFKADLEKKWTNSNLIINAMALSSSQKDKQIAGHSSAEIKATRNISGRINISLGANYTKNEFAGFKYRLQIGPGLGIDAVKNDAHSLNATFSTVIFWERTTAAGSDTERFFSFKIAFNDQWKINKNVLLKNKADYFVPFEDSSKYFLNWAVSIEAVLDKTLSLGVGYTIHYQNKLHNPELKNTDSTIMTSLIATF